jgi:hypothetical protein
MSNGGRLMIRESCPILLGQFKRDEGSDTKCQEMMRAEPTQLKRDDYERGAEPLKRRVGIRISNSAGK